MPTTTAILAFALAGWMGVQEPNGGIAGVVRDESGALLPGVRVTATRLATGVSTAGRTSATGSYLISRLLPGLYRVLVSLEGFETVVREPVQVDAGVTTTSVDFTLPAGNVETAIHVSGAAPLLREADVAVGHTLKSDALLELPVNGLHYMTHTRTEPGVQGVFTSGGRSFVDIGGAPQGNPGRGTLAAMDGASFMAVGAGGSSMSFWLESVEEVRISTTTFPLSTGATVSGVVSAITRSGGNEAHGGGFYAFRDHNFDAFPALKRDPANPKPFFQRRQFGVNANGPVRKDRLFLFGSYERNEQRGVIATTLGGPDFGHLSRITTSPFFQDLFSVRVDGNLPGNHRLFFRDSHDASRSFAPGIFFPNALPSRWFRITSSANQAVLGLTSPVSETLVNDFRLSYFSPNSNRAGPRAHDCIGCLGVGAPAINVAQAGLAIGNSDIVEIRSQRFQVNDSATLAFGNHNAVFGFDWQHNRGGQINWSNEPATIALFSPDQARQAGIPVPAAFNTLEDILSLPVNTVTIAVGDPRVPQANGGRVRTWNTLRLYFQDKWPVHPRLALNYGLAWSIDRNLNYDVAAPQFLEPIVESGLRPRRKEWTNFSPLFGFTWRPPESEQLLIRSGVALYYDFLIPPNPDSERVAYGPPGLGRQTFRGPGIVNTLPGVPNLPVGRSLDFRTPTAFTGLDLLPILKATRDVLLQSAQTGDEAIQQIQVTKTGSVLSAEFPVGSALHANAGFTHQWNEDFAIDADIVFRRFTHFIIGMVDVSRALPVCDASQRNDPSAQCLNGPLHVAQPVGGSTYKGLLVRAEKRLTRDLWFIGSWAYSKHTGTSEATANGFNLDSWHENTGPLATDFTHIFNLAGGVRLPHNFRLGLNFSYLSAPPFSAYLEGIDLNGDGLAGDLLPGSTVRAFNRGMEAADLERLVDRFNQTYAGTTDAQGVFIAPLTLPEKYWFGDSTHTLDLRLSRPFRFAERSEMTLIGEVFNLYNAANLSGHSGNLTNSATFGQPTARSSQVFGSGGARAFQFSAKIRF